MSRSRFQPLRIALAAMIAASAFFALATLFAKSLGSGALGDPLPIFMVSAGRFVFALSAVGVAAMWLRPKLWSERSTVPWRLHAARSACGWAAVSCIFAAAASMPLGDAIAISFLSPVVTILLAGSMLGERVDAARWRAVALAAVGAAILVQPGSDAFQPAAAFALGAAVLQGVEAILIKRLSTSEPPIRILLINNFFGAAIACAVAAMVWTAPTAAQWAGLVGVGLAMAAAQTCFIQSVSRADASLVTPAFYATLVFAALYDFAAFGVAPSLAAVAGASLIAVAVISLSIARPAPPPAQSPVASRPPSPNAPDQANQ